MKHIFAFIDKLIILLGYVPKSLDSKQDKAKAKKAILLIKEYTGIVQRLLENHKIEEHLTRLHQANNKGINDWANKIETVFAKIEKLLQTLEEDIPKLKEALHANPDQWQSKITDLSLGMVQSGLHMDEEDAEQLKEAIVFEIHELENVIAHERHVEGLHFWQTLADLEEKKQLLEHEKFFEKLLN